MGHGHFFAFGVHHAFFPLTLKVETVVGAIFPVTNPVWYSVVNEDIGPDNFSAVTAQAVHQVGVAFPVDILYDTKNPFFRIDCPKNAVFIYPELGEVVADEVGPDHGGGGLSAS